tara:strand:+ start:71050 stop:71532 length:483 start_codon:yes stop_codon:yes gene_type:complete
MAPPIIKQIELLSDKKENIYNFLNEQDFDERPCVISLMKFPEKQEQLIEVIGEILRDKSFLYPIYIYTTLIDYPTQLNLVDNLNQVPKYYKQKTKQLNIKENLVYNKIKLKQDQLRSINRAEVDPIIKEFALEHKMIKEKEDFNIYLKKIISGIRKKHDA